MSHHYFPEITGACFNPLGEGLGWAVLCHGCRAAVPTPPAVLGSLEADPCLGCAVLQLVNPFLPFVRFLGGMWVVVCGPGLEPCWWPVRRGERAGQLWWLLQKGWKGPALIRNSVRGEMWEPRALCHHQTSPDHRLILPLWMRTNKPTNQLSWQAGCSSGLSGLTPDLFSSVPVHFSSIDWEMEEALLFHMVYLNDSLVFSRFSQSCRFYPISLRQFLSSCSFLLELFCSISKLSKLLIWDLTFAALSFQTGMCFSFLLQCSREYHRMLLLKSY